MNFDDLKSSSKYLTQKDVPDQGLDLTVAGFELVTMKDNAQKVVMSFREPGVKPMIVNATNRNRLTALCKSSESRNMVGHRVNVYCDPSVEMGGELVGGLRIRPCSVHGPIPAPVQDQVATVSDAALQAALKLLQARAKADAQTKPAPVKVGPAGPADPFDDEIPF